MVCNELDLTNLGVAACKAISRGDGDVHSCPKKKLKGFISPNCWRYKEENIKINKSVCIEEIGYRQDMTY